jgi:ribonuclease BN (tRNA processing enzyme)
MLTQIGNGTAFNPETPNTSFLLKDFLLIDCGYNVFKELKENFNIEKIKLIAITHNHADHIGSLETLLFYKKFKLDTNNKSTVILIPKLL